MNHIKTLVFVSVVFLGLLASTKAEDKKRVLSAVTLLDGETLDLGFIEYSPLGIRGFVVFKNPKNERQWTPIFIPMSQVKHVLEISDGTIIKDDPNKEVFKPVKEK